MDSIQRTAAAFLTVGLVALFVGLWAAWSLGVALCVGGAVLVALGVWMANE